MKELFEYILIALACPLVLPLVETQESEKISERNMKMWEEIFKAESEDKK